jgi:hypothetical protein
MVTRESKFYRVGMCLAVGCLALLGFMSCSPEDPKAGSDTSISESLLSEDNPGHSSKGFRENSEADTDVAESNVSSGTTISESLLSEDIPGHINKVFSENFAADTDVPAFQAEKADVLFASYKRFDEHTVLSTLFGEKSPSKETYTVDKSTSIGYHDEAEDSYGGISEGSVYYSEKDYAYISFPTENFSTKNDFSSFPRYNEVYVKENLNFMAGTEAVKTVSEILKQLSIETSDNVEIYAIDYQTMQAQQEERIRQEKERQSDPTEYYQIKSEFTEEDEFYILCFTMMQDQIPITHNSYQTVAAGERIVNGSNAKVYLSKKGVIYLQCSGIYQADSVAESPGTLITAEKILQKAYEIYDSFVSTQKVTVIAMDFEYAPVPYNKNYDEVKLTPAWTLTLSYENELSKNGIDPDAVVRTITINAVTGEEIK